MVTAKSFDEEISLVSEWVRERIEESTSPQEIAVFVRSIDQFGPRSTSDRQGWSGNL